MTGIASRFRAAAGLVALGLALAGLVPSLAFPAPAGAIGCITNCTALTVVLSGPGSGTWRTTNSSHVPNNVINCTLTNGAMSGNCFFKYQNTFPPQVLTIYWVETPATDNKGCDSSVGTCQAPPQTGSFTMQADKSVSNWSFQPDPEGWSHVTISIDGTGTGSVANSVGAGACTTAASPCYFAYPFTESSATFTAAASPGSFFVRWGDPSCGSYPACTVGGSAGFSMSATFNLVGGPTPSPSVAPTASPKPSATPGPTPTAAVPTPTPAGTSATPGHSAGAIASPGATSGQPTPGPGASNTGSGPGSSGVPASAGPEGSSANPDDSTAPASAGDIAAAGSLFPGETPLPADASNTTSPTGSDGLTIAIVIAVGLVVAGLLVAVSILVSVRLRRPPAGEG